MTQKSSTGAVGQFVKYLQKELAGFVFNEDGEWTGEVNEEQRNRAALARLRRSRGKHPNQSHEAHRYVTYFTGGISGWKEECFYYVAELFAAYPDREGSWSKERDGEGYQQTNLGASFRKLVDKLVEEDESLENEEEKRKKATKRVERRFTALLATSRNNLPDRLNHALSLLKAKEVPVDWQELLYNLQQWEGQNPLVVKDNQRPSVQRQWAKAFWSLPQNQPESSGSPSESDTAHAAPEADDETQPAMED